MCTMNRTGRKFFGPDGCQVPIGNEKCGETRTLDILNEFKRLYEEKMKEIDNSGGGDCLQEKIKLQQDWIGDLTDQNEVLVRAVEELEIEATERVNMLEEKLQQSAKCMCEVMKRYREYDNSVDMLKEPQEKIFRLENDLKNLLEFLRRVRVENEWSTSGLSFTQITYQDLFGDKNGGDLWKEKCDRYLICDNAKEEKKVMEQESKIRELHSKLGDVNDLSKELNAKKQECETLQKNLVDVRQALTEEVAAKHDTILKLKRDCHDLEERCVRADKQTAFRDDIIRELRKEIKQLKQQENDLESLKYSVSLIASPLNVNISKLSDSLRKKNLYSFMEGEIVQLNKIVEINRKQLDEQLKLITILVQRLCKYDAGLKFIEERVRSVNSVSLEKSKTELHAKNLDLVKEKAALESNVKEYKTKLKDLEDQFKEFLKDKAQLKEKYVAVKNQCRCVLEETVKLKSENDALKKKAEDFQTDNQNYVNSKVLLEAEMKKLKENLENLNSCSSQVEKLTKDNKKLMSDLCNLNEENRNLLKSVDEQKTQINLTTTVTCDEFGKLNSTIEDLQKTLEKTKKLQEQEDKDKMNTINALNNTIAELRSNLKVAEEKVKVCKVCRGRSRVGFAEISEVQTDESAVSPNTTALLHDRDELILSQYETLNMFQQELQSLKAKETEQRKETKETTRNNNGTQIDDERLEKLIETVQNRDGIIRNQNQTLKLVQEELQLSKKKELDVKLEKEKCCCSIEHLKQKIVQLEAALKNAEGRADNLQIAIEQQRSTIANLQSALVGTKHELDFLKQKSEENFMEQQRRFSRFISVMADTEIEKEKLQTLCAVLLKQYQELQELNLGIEIEYCNNLQDVDELDNQLFKYQREIKYTEVKNRQSRNSFEKLKKQKSCYEEIISYFKREMGQMSEQLQNLQDLLVISNDSVHEERSKLSEAFENAQTLNRQLSTQLTAAEQKALLDHQMNQLHEAKIGELERLVSEKEVDLGRHDRAILDVRRTLRDALQQNEELHGAVRSLNDTVSQLQRAVHECETDNCQSRASNENCQAQIESCKEKLVELKGALEKKTAELCKLEMAYNNQNRTLKAAQNEMKEMREKQKSKQCHMKCVIGELKDKLGQYEGKHKGVLEELKQLQTQLGIVTRRDAVKEIEIKRYRKIIGDLKRTLIELNKSLSRKNVRFESRCDNEECKRYMEQSEELRDQQESPLNCPCEVEFYQSIVETLKKSVIDLKTKLADTQRTNRALEEDRNRTESQSQTECDRLKRQLAEELKRARSDETRYSEMADRFERELGSLRQQLEAKAVQLDECRKSAQEVNSCRCVQLACAQEEAGALKEQLNDLLAKHCALNVENEQLHSQTARMRSTVVGLEERSQLLQGRVEQYLQELRSLRDEKQRLLEKNGDLLGELRSLAGRQQRYESELTETRNNRDEICVESGNVLSCFRKWVREQRRRERGFCETIRMLRRENEDLRFQGQPCVRTASPPPSCHSPWSMGSRGTASGHEESPPSGSPDRDWFSQSFRNESEEDDEDWVTKVEDLAAQVKRTNRMWKNKMRNSDFAVTRDPMK